jgi:hypothetical protein
MKGISRKVREVGREGRVAGWDKQEGKIGMGQREGWWNEQGGNEGGMSRMGREIMSRKR